MESVKNIAVLGNGSLSRCFADITKHNITFYNKPDVDFLNPDSLDAYYADFLKYDIILNTIGIDKGSTNSILQVNYFTPIQLLEKLNLLNYLGKVIMIGSHASSWTSWPKISIERLAYNVSKANLKSHIYALSHSNLLTFQVCVLDFSKFISPMSGYEGCPIEDVANTIEQIIDINSPKILHIETY